MDDKIGVRIRSLRDSAGKSMEKFGEEFGISLPTVVRLEKGEAIPRIDLLMKIVNKYGCDLAWLVTGKKSDLGIPVVRRLGPSGENDTIGRLVVPGLGEQGIALIVASEDAVPTVRPGDTVVVASQAFVNGDLVAYRSEWNDTRVRRYVAREMGVFLVAEFPGLPDIVVDAGLRIYGKITYVVRCIAV